MSLLDLFRSRKLSTVLEKTHQVKVHGVKFEIRKINSLDYLNGSKALVQSYDTYKAGSDKTEEALVNVNKIKSHYIDVFMASVVKPELSREKTSVKGIWVENLLQDWELATDLYAKIMEITYGKKKMRSLISQEKSS
jgi:hypothetical protein